MATFLLWKVARPQAEYPLKQTRGFAAAAASFFLSDQKETKESPGVVILRKDLRLTPWSFRNPTPGPPFYRGARGVRGQSRPARKPYEKCLCLLTAVFLNKPDRLLLQDTMRLSCRTYTVGAGRRADEDIRPYCAPRNDRVKNLAPPMGELARR